MPDDRINALLTFAGGLLVFLAALVPVIRSFIKWFRNPGVISETRFWASILLPASLPIPAYYFIVHSDSRFVGVIFLSVFLIWQLVDFLRAKGPITRVEIFAFCAFPLAYFTFMFCQYTYYQMADQLIQMEMRLRIEKAISENKEAEEEEKAVAPTPNS